MVGSFELGLTGTVGIVNPGVEATVGISELLVIGGLFKLLIKSGGAEFIAACGVRFAVTGLSKGGINAELEDGRLGADVRLGAGVLSEAGVGGVGHIGEEFRAGG